MLREAWVDFQRGLEEERGGIEDWKRFCKFCTGSACIGFRFGPAHIKKYMFCHLFTIIFLIVLWIRYNEGLIPKFLLSSTATPLAGDMSLLDHYPYIQGDASKVSFGCESNSILAIEQAVKENKMVLEGDIILKGQGTSQQQFKPVMANMPVVDSDLTFADWLASAKTTGRALKLDFQSIEAVEISLQTLNQLEEPLRVPLWLSGEILSGPNAQQKPLDPNRFLRICTENYQHSTLLLGWRTGKASSDSSNVYEWSSVKEMHDLLEKWEISQPLVFAVQAAYVKRSLPQLKWLMEMTTGALAIFTSENDGITASDLMYIRHRLPISHVYYDLSDSLQGEFEAQRDDASLHLPTSVRLSQPNETFHAEDWIVAPSGKKDEVYLGTNAVLLRHGLLISKGVYQASDTEIVTISGRVEFLAPEPMVSDNPPDPEVTLEVYLRVSQGARPSAISGIKCVISSSGKLGISAQSIPGSDAHSEVLWRDMPVCVDFIIQDLGTDKILMQVIQPVDCYSSGSQAAHSETVALHTDGITLNSGQVVIRGNSQTGFIAIPSFFTELKR